MAAARSLGRANRLSAHSGSAAIETPTGKSSTADKTGPLGWYTVGILAVVSMLSYVDRGVMALFVEPMKRDFGLSDTEMGWLLGLAFTLPYVLVGIPMARLIDRGSRRNLIAGALAIWSFATALCGIAQNYATLFVCRFVTGSAESVNTSGAYSMVADAVSRKMLPRAYAILSGGVTGGAALSLLVGGVLYGMLVNIPPTHVGGIGVIHNWQLVFMIVGLPGLLAALLMWRTVPEPVRRGGTRPEGYPVREVLGFVKEKGALHGPLLAGTILLATMSHAFAAWMPAFYDRSYGWGPEVAGPIMGIMSLVASVIGLIGGAKLAEWMGERRADANLRVVFLVNLVSWPLLTLAPLMPNAWLALICASLAGAIGIMAGPPLMAAIQLTTPNEMRAQMNVMYGAGMTAIGGSVGPFLVGFLTDYVAPSTDDLRYVLVAVKFVLGPMAIFLLWKAVGPYGRIYSQRLEEEQQ